MEEMTIEQIESCNFMTNVLENMQDMVRVINKNGNIIFMNKEMRNNFGDLIGKKCYEGIKKTQKCSECISQKSLEFHKAFSKEEKIDSHIFSVVSTPVFNRNTNEYYMVEVFRDITKQKEIEGKLLEQYTKMKSDLDFAKHIQTKILPKNGIYGGSIEVTSKYEPSEFLGGDIFDIFEIDENNVGIYIADISGHGVTASMFTMFLRQVMRNKQNKSASVEETINDLIKSYKELNIDMETYFTVVYGVYNKQNNIITMVNAGHNCYPIVIRENKIIEEVEINGLPICSLVDRYSHQSREMKLNKGDKVIFYTDGIIEAYNKKSQLFFGYNNLCNVIRRNLDKANDKLVSTIYEEVINFTSGMIKDDIAIVLFEIL